MSRSPGTRVLSATLVPALAWGAALRAEPIVRDGFSLEPPPGWIVTTPDQQEMLEHAPDELKKAIAAVDFSRFSVYLIEPTQDGFHENLSVQVDAGEVSIDEAGKQGLSRQLTRSCADAGIAIRGLELELATFGGHRGISMHVDMRMPGMQEEMRVWQALLPGDRRTLTVTCTALRDDFARLEPTFRAILESLRFEGPAPSREDTAAYVLGLLIGGLPVLVVGIVLIRRMKPAARRGGGGSPAA